MLFPAIAGIIIGRRAKPLARFGGHNGSAAATAVSDTSAIFVPIAEFIVSMNVFATTAYPVLVG